MCESLGPTQKNRLPQKLVTHNFLVLITPVRTVAEEGTCRLNLGSVFVKRTKCLADVLRDRQKINNNSFSLEKMTQDLVIPLGARLSV